MAHWIRGGISFWAVSDLNEAELAGVRPGRFRRFEAAGGRGRARRRCEPAAYRLGRALVPFFVAAAMDSTTFLHGAVVTISTL